MSRFSKKKLKEIKIREELLKNNLENVLERAEYELEIIDKMGYNGYFIIVWDFIKFSRENGIYVGPGRGSAAGSIVSYALNITEIDPLKYNLIFERFLNPERISMPDIDIDFDQEQREIVIDYVVNKYGTEYVAHIITFGTLKARLAIRDVGRVLNVSLAKVDKIAKMIPFNTELKEALNNIPEFKKMYETDEEIKKVIDYSLKLEGKVRHASVHAAGVVISKDVLSDEIPTYSDGKTKIVSTQYQMKELEELGILKMDFLGLKNLTILRKTVENINLEKKRKGQKDKVILNDIPLNDEKTYELLTKADTMGVFQCESAGIRSLMKKMKIEKFEDIIALLALYRPGPLRSGMVDDFINIKNNKTEIKYIDNSLKYILEETYGIILYQEQVMKIVSEMANYSLGEADELRRAIGKKIPELMKKNREKFVKNAQKKGVLIKKANEIYDLVEKFGGYGFNKSHAVAYGLVAYQLAYLKANYPLEFYTSILNSVIGDSTKSAIYITECRRKNISIEAPDVNRSTDIYYHNGKSIILPLSIIKDVGTLAARTILDERNKSGNFGDYFDFVARVVLRKINRTQLERLISAGALDDFDLGRTTMLNTLDDAIKYAKLIQVPFGTQLSIDPQLVSKPVVIRMKDSQEELSENEKAALGFNLGEQPIVHLRQKLGITYPPLAELNSNRGLYRGFAYIQSVRQIRTRKGDLMCFLKLTDETGESDMAVMPNLYSQYSQYLVKGVYIQFYAKIQDEASFLANQIEIVRQK